MRLSEAGLWLWLLLTPLAAFADGIDLSADRVTRDEYGVVTANGNVGAQYKDDLLQTDQITYDPVSRMMSANGHLTIQTEDCRIEASSGQLKLQDRYATLTDAEMILNSGEQIHARKLERLSAEVYEGHDLRFSACSGDHPAWELITGKATLDRDEGTLRAINSSFEFYGMRLFYLPYWKQPLRRMSGVLFPKLSSGKRRGTEIALPLYWAPAQNWDATLTPHWMSLRGFMPEIEGRYLDESLTANGHGSYLHDQLTNSSRGHFAGNLNWQATESLSLTLKADHLSDRHWLADYADDALLAASRYTQSQAAVQWRSANARWRLLASHQLDISAPDNSRTSQIAPRLEGEVSVQMPADIILTSDQQLTQFQRRQGVDGWRLVWNPELELPFTFFDGSVESSFGTGMRLNHYLLTQTAGRRSETLASFNTHLESRLLLEKVADDRSWRHTLEPTLRFDWVTVADQTTLPNFDSAFGEMTMANLLSANRFSGSDRVERVQRISLLVGSRFDTRDQEQNSPHQWLAARIGASYNIQRLSIDPAVQKSLTRPFSNLLAEAAFSPWEGISLNADGQYNPAEHYFTTSQASLNWLAENSDHLVLTLQSVNPRYAAPGSRSLVFDGLVHLGPRWEWQAAWSYDAKLRLTQNASTIFRYLHPCWDASMQIFRLYRPSGSSSASDFGFRFLIGFKGLGSVGA